MRTPVNFAPVLAKSVFLVGDKVAPFNVAALACNHMHLRLVLLDNAGDSIINHQPSNYGLL